MSTTQKSMTQSIFYVAIVFILWLIPSIGLIHKYLGNIGILAALLFFLLLVLLIKILQRQLVTSVPIWWFLALSIVAICVFIVLYPIAKSGVLGPGSDRDDALNVALRAFLAGQYPYSVDTYLGNPPTPMPGALILALPFYMLGNSALQNLIWIPGFIFWCATVFKDRMIALTYLALFVLASPAAMDDFVTGGDYLTNAIYVAVAMQVMITAEAGEKVWFRRGAEIFLAIAISSRPIYVIAIPVLAGVIYRMVGFRRMIDCILFVLAVCLLLNAPFYLYDPSRFPTAHLSKPSDFLPFPHGGIILAILAGMIGYTSFFIRNDLHLIYALFGVTLGVMFYPVLAFEIFTLPIDPLGPLGFALPVTIFAGFWCTGRLLSALQMKGS
jgi:hypothetical protein